MNMRTEHFMPLQQTPEMLDHEAWFIVLIFYNPDLLMECYWFLHFILSDNVCAEMFHVYGPWCRLSFGEHVPRELQPSWWKGVQNFVSGSNVIPIYLVMFFVLCFSMLLLFLPPPTIGSGGIMFFGHPSSHVVRPSVNTFSHDAISLYLTRSFDETCRV